MDDLTQRALSNQNTAAANYSDKLKREQEQQKLTEAPAFVTGFEGGKYQVQRLGEEPTATGVPVTNGLLQTGQRVTTIGQFVDGVSRVQPTKPAVAAIEATGKIKYLYSVLNADSSRDLWLGGWQPKPVKIKEAVPDGSRFFLRNTGGNSYFVDSAASNIVTSFTEQGEVYRYDLTGFGGGIALRGYSFGTDNGGSGPGGYTYWSNLFQGVFRGGLNTDVYGRVYLLPNLLSPTGEFYDERGFVYVGGPINQNGTRGVGVRQDVDTTGSATRYQIAIYSEAGGIVDTGVAQVFDTSDLECFDANFSVIGKATLSTDIFSKPKFTTTIAIYGFDAIQQRTVKTTVYGIPTTQRSSATLIGQPSYHPN